MKTHYYKKELVSTYRFSELEYEMYGVIGVFENDNTDCDVVLEPINYISNNRYRTNEATPIEINALLSVIDNAQKEGANFVEIEHNIDNQGYDISFLKISKANEFEIEEFKTKHSLKQKEFLFQEISRSKKMLDRMQLEYENL